VNPTKSNQKINLGYDFSLMDATVPLFIFHKRAEGILFNLKN
jgi:hypothetical protein